MPFLEGYVYRKKMFTICTYYSLNHSLYDVFENNKTLRQGNDYFSPVCLLLFNQTFFAAYVLNAYLCRLFLSYYSSYNKICTTYVWGQGTSLCAT